MPKIKVLYVIGSANLGGAEVIMRSLLENMNKEKFELYVVCPFPGDMLKAYQAYAWLHERGHVKT